jgi:hypothetical protein
MKLLANRGNWRVLDELEAGLPEGGRLDVMSPLFSLFSWSTLVAAGRRSAKARLVLPTEDHDLELLGGDAERAARNQLQSRWLAARCLSWLEQRAEVRRARGRVPQGAFVTRSERGVPTRAVIGAVAVSAEGLGLAPGNALGLAQATESDGETKDLAAWFDEQWAQLGPSSPDTLRTALQSIASTKAPHQVYALMLHHLLGGEFDGLDEDRVLKAATGIRNTQVWKKLYKFQRDGVVGVIDKLDRFGGCILADSVGLGKTFEALAVIKYHELRNDRVLVLCPKRLRDNWTIYTANDRRNVLAADRFNFDVLNHTDLSRESGLSGDIDLAHVNWGNYDLVVIDESHNFRNKLTRRQGESRYDRLMRQIIKQGVKTRVLMLSATPVNNRLADLRNQIAFITEGDDAALLEHGIGSIETTTRLAQLQFNRWLALDEAERVPAKLIEMLGFDYFTLLDLLTIARSRKHIEKYYGTKETGRFPERLKPINLKAEVDRAGKFRAIAEINLEIRRLKLASYAPLRYVLPAKQKAYDAKYSMQVRGGEGFFRQADREESLIHLLRVNLLKRMESAVSSFALTLERLLADVEKMLSRIESHEEALDEVSIEDVDLDDPAFEPLLVGNSKVKVMLKDVDLVRWRQDLVEDRNRLATLCSAAKEVDTTRDAKLYALKEILEVKLKAPINPGNRKVIVFTAFADTAKYLYAQLGGWAKERHGIHSALVTGAGANQTTVPGLSKDLASILTAFSPRSKERPAELSAEGDIELLIATDCISEGQNLQDCDWLINYDIHWNPVRIIQRFGRIDRLGSPNSRIQLVNFWPNMELEEYINLEQRVSGRMVLLDVSATGEENLIEQQSGDQMNDLEYRRKQLLKLQDAVIDLEDLSTGVSIADLTLTDFRIDLAQHQKAHPGQLDAMPMGVWAVTTTNEEEVPPGVLFCLRAEGEAARRVAESGYPLAPHYLVHVGEDGAVLLPYTQAKRGLDRLKRVCVGRDLPDDGACARFDRATRHGEDMQATQRQLAAAIASVVGKHEERAMASLFSPGGTHAMKGEFAGMTDFEVMAFLVVLTA